MLNITAKQDTMRTIVEILTVLVEDAKFKFEEGHIEVRAVDAMHVAMVRMEIDSAAFEAWECEPCTIGFELVKLRDLIGLAEPGDLIEMNYDENDGRVNIQVGEINRTIRPLDRATMLEPRVPDVELHSSVALYGQPNRWVTSQQSPSTHNPLESTSVEIPIQSTSLTMQGNWKIWSVTAQSRANTVSHSSIQWPSEWKQS